MNNPWLFLVILLSKDINSRQINTQNVKIHYYLITRSEGSKSSQILHGTSTIFNDVH